MAGFVRMMTLVAMMLASWATGAWAIQCSDATTSTSVGTITSLYNGGNWETSGDLPLTMVPGDRITSMRAVWNLNGGRTIAGGLGGRIRYVNSQASTQEADFTAVGLNSGSSTFNFTFLFEATTNEPFTRVQVNVVNTGLGVTTIPAPDTTTRFTAEIFLTCLPSPNQPTTTTVSSAPNPSTPGQNVVLTANVAADSGTPTGTVEFFDDGVSLGSSALVSGAATLNTTALAVGANNITAVYSGAAGFATSASAASVHSVNLIGVRMTLQSSLNPSLQGQAVTFRATAISASGPAAGVVEFREGATVLGTGTLDAGGVTLFTTSALSVTSHPVQAFYLGNGVFAPNNSPVLNQVVNPQPNTTDFSARLDDVQEAATGVAAVIASDNITESVAEELSAALSGQVQVVSASDGKVGLVYAPGIGRSIVTPTADLASGETSIATWRVWTSLRYSDFDSSKLEGDQINALIGTSFLFADGLAAGLVAGYEKQDYEDDLNSTLKGEGFNIGGYVGGTLGNGMRFDAQVHTSFLDYDLASGPVTGSTDATRLIVSGGVAHIMQFGATTFEPTARLNGTWEWQDGYTDSAAVVHDDRNFNFGRIATGAKLAHRFDMGDGASFSPYVQGFADYRFSGGDTTNESLLDGLSARVGLGASLNTASGISASVLAEFSGLGLDDNVMVQSYKAQIAIPF